MSVLGDNNADIENNYKNYVEKLENLHNKKI
jgi:ABC-type Zn uptake system ZnuABC Zn-binding protein ZnuA